MRRWLRVALAVVLAATVAGGCSAGSSNPDSSNPHSSLRVSAAASLTEAFTALASEFEERHGDVDVEFNFGSSAALAEQLARGAPADVFASADATTIDRARDGGLVRDPRRIARNRLTIVVEKGNPKGIERLGDLARSDVVVVHCVATAPCGRLTRAALDASHVTFTPASLEENVKGVLSKVVLGEADAGLVYETDVVSAAAEVDAVSLEVSEAVETEVMIATVTGSSSTSLARMWIELVSSREGQAVLARHGFRRA